MPPLHKPVDTTKLPFHSRKELALKRREKYPAHIPVIIKKGLNVLEIHPKEFMISCSNSLLEFPTERHMSPYN